MGDITVIGGLHFSFPDRFRVLSEAELDTIYRDSNHDRAGVFDDESQAAAVVFWHKAGAFVSKLAGAKTVCRSTESRIGRRLSEHGYVFDSFFEREVGGLDAYGFRHRYVRQGTEFTSEITVFKKDRVTYTVYTYVGTEAEEADMPVIRGIVDSMGFIRRRVRTVRYIQNNVLQRIGAVSPEGARERERSVRESCPFQVIYRWNGRQRRREGGDEHSSPAKMCGSPFRWVSESCIAAFLRHGLHRDATLRRLV